MIALSDTMTLTDSLSLRLIEIDHDNDHMPMNDCVVCRIRFAVCFGEEIAVRIEDK